MALERDMADRKLGNLVPLRLHVPEPKYRPGDAVDFSDINVPPVDAIPMPDESAHPSLIQPLAFGLVRVLGDDHKAAGSWNPNLDADRLRRN